MNYFADHSIHTLIYMLKPQSQFRLNFNTIETESKKCIDSVGSILEFLHFVHTISNTIHHKINNIDKTFSMLRLLQKVLFTWMRTPTNNKAKNVNPMNIGKS
jgi:hypothetical protein